MTDKLFANFIIGNLATDLIDLTIKMCVRDSKSKTYRFPVVLYPSYVKDLMTSAVNIHRYVCDANSLEVSDPERNKQRRRAMGECAHISGMVFSCLKKGWISEKQHDTWQKLIGSIFWKLRAWK